jgi:hypothetical protein
MPITRNKKDQLEKDGEGTLSRFKTFISNKFSAKKQDSVNRIVVKKQEEDIILQGSNNKRKFLSYNSKHNVRFGTVPEQSRQTKLTEMQQVFDVFDSDRDGYVTVNEFISVINQLGLNLAMNEAEVNELFKLVVQDNDRKKLNFSDFITLFNMCS